MTTASYVDWEKPDATVAERVAAGAAWLDGNQPGWVDRIDLERLDIGSCMRCVLGQLYGEYSLAPLEVRYDYDTDVWLALSFGFDAVNRPGQPSVADVTAEWRRLILARRSA